MLSFPYLPVQNTTKGSTVDKLGVIEKKVFNFEICKMNIFYEKMFAKVRNLIF